MPTDSPLERIGRALEELKSLPLPAAAGSSEKPGVPSESVGAGAGESPPQNPAGDPASGATAPAPGDEEPAIRVARTLLQKRVDSALDALVVSERAARALLKESGAVLGLNDAGEPALALPDGTEHPLTAESLRAAGIDDSLLRPAGKPGSGLTETGTAPRSVDPLDYLRTQEAFDKNRRAVLEAVARRRR